MPHAFSVAFDVISVGETWCRLVALVDEISAAHLGRKGIGTVKAARNALLGLLATKAVSVSCSSEAAPG